MISIEDQDRLEAKGAKILAVAQELLTLDANFSGEIDHGHVAAGLIACHAHALALAQEATALDPHLASDWEALDHLAKSADLHLRLAEACK